MIALTEKEQVLGNILSQIADELNITETMQEKAVDSYKAVGKWLGDGIPYDIQIMPQGSMNLGTVIKPIDDTDDYDMDLVCLLKNGRALSLSKIKNLVGARLKANDTYAKKLEKEGKRCWTMQYAEFHMDILPCVPAKGEFIEPKQTDIKLTHKNDAGVYEARFSNPYAYHLWFESQMKDVLWAEKCAFASMSKTTIESVPTYKVRTPLQKVIQLLKRHRDICFESNNEDAPISIIITTLAAHAYQGEKDVYSALCNILQRMPQYIERRNNEYWIANPVMSKENFADKWNIEPNKQTAFTAWLNRAQKELIKDPLSVFGLDTIADQYKKVLGKAPVERAFLHIADNTKKSRDIGKLYVNGLKGGLTTTPGKTSKPVKEHTFFGK